MVCGYTHTQPSSGKRGIRIGTLQDTPAVTVYPLTETAQAPTNKRNQTTNTAGIHRPTSIVCWTALCVIDCASVRAAQAVSLCLTSATALGGTRHTFLRRRDLVACPTNHRCLSLINLLVTRIGLVLLHCLYRL